MKHNSAAKVNKFSNMIPNKYQKNVVFCFLWCHNIGKHTVNQHTNTQSKQVPNKL